ncbi:MAG: SCP2 sterol-binding domain-containing protein [Pseudomonadales bacterium]
MPDPTLSIAACAGLERAINFTLGLDYAVAQKFAAYSGRIVKLHADDPQLAIYIELGERCRVLYHCASKPDVALGGALADWFELARSNDKAATLINGGLAIQGNSKILLALAEAAATLDIDWEAQLAEIIGDVPAHLTGRAMRSAAEIGTQAASVAQQLVDRLAAHHSAAQPANMQTDPLGDGLRTLSAGLGKIAAQRGESTAQGKQKNARTGKSAASGDAVKK